MSLTEITLILFVALVLFGPEDLPVVARALGKIVFQVRKYTNEIGKEVKNAFDTPSNTINQVLKEPSAKPKQPPKEKTVETNEEFLTYEDTVKEEAPKSPDKTLNPLAELPEEIVFSPKETQAGE